MISSQIGKDVIGDAAPGHHTPVHISHDHRVVIGHTGWFEECGIILNQVGAALLDGEDPVIVGLATSLAERKVEGDRLRGYGGCEGLLRLVVEEHVTRRGWTADIRQRRAIAIEGGAGHSAREGRRGERGGAFRETLPLSLLTAVRRESEAVTAPAPEAKPVSALPVTVVAAMAVVPCGPVISPASGSVKFASLSAVVALPVRFPLNAPVVVPASVRPEASCVLPTALGRDIQGRHSGLHVERNRTMRMSDNPSVSEFAATQGGSPPHIDPLAISFRSIGVVETVAESNVLACGDAQITNLISKVALPR